MVKKVKYYIIEKILGERFRNGKVEQLIKWKGYSSKSNSWEPISNYRKKPEMKQRKKNKNTKAVPQKKKTVSKAIPRTTKKSSAETVPLSPVIKGSSKIPTASSTATQTTDTSSDEKRPKKKLPKKFFEIEKMLASRIVNDKKEYLVHWKNYREDESTWEPEHCLKEDYCHVYCDSLKRAFFD